MNETSNLSWQESEIESACKLPLSRATGEERFQDRRGGTISPEKSRFSEAKIVSVIKEAGACIKAADVCRKHGVSEPTYYNWSSNRGPFSWEVGNGES